MMGWWDSLKASTPEIFKRRKVLYIDTTKYSSFKTDSDVAQLPDFETLKMMELFAEPDD